MAKALGVPCELGRADVRALAASTGAGLEEAGRAARYAFLEEVRQRHGAEWILLAHHADDLVEDVLLRLIRGAGWPALGGMPALDAQRHLLRPFLELSKSELEAFARQEGAAWLHDASNESDAFRRNRLRHHVLPLLFAENPALRRTIARLWELAREDERFWESYLSPIVSTCLCGEGEAALAEAKARALPRAARLRLFAKLIAHVGRGKGQPRAETLFALDNALLAPQRPKRFQFPGGITATLHGGVIRFARG
ncbi:MAG: tRNA lysidine(34) synthetase TilS, partial [Desulfovibrionaceae bacterium]|nr:tRNA lysidine(34) synthetase TilS [Desulfovibrionaceae bacterium]